MRPDKTTVGLASLLTVVGILVGMEFMSSLEPMVQGVLLGMLATVGIVLTTLGAKERRQDDDTPA